MIRNMSGISKKEKNHPQASDGSSRLMIKNPSSVPTGTENIITQNVAKSNSREKIIKLIYLLLRAGSVLKRLNTNDTIFVVRETIKKWFTDR